MVWNRQKPETSTTPERPFADPVPPAPTRSAAPASTQVHIGKSVRIKGDVTADEDLSIEGTVEGKVRLKKHVLRVGPNGRITSEIAAMSVVVAGEVAGNVTAADKVEIAATGTMNGDICAPRVVLADGARFKGRIDMEPKASTASRTSPSVSVPAKTA